MRTILFQIALFAIALLFSFAISKWLKKWIVRRKIKRLKADFAKLEQTLLQVEQMKSAIRSWMLKH